MSDRPAAGGSQARGALPAACITAAAAVTMLDGFDAFSLALMAPHMRAEMGFAPAQLGTVFASALAGMILGAILGGLLADRFGRTRILLAALAVFGTAALAMPQMSTLIAIIANRTIAGVGLGAAAPIAVALLNRPGLRPPSELVVALVWASIPAGGILAALYNQFAVPIAGWRSMFVLGGLLPLPVAMLAWATFRGAGRPITPITTAKRSRPRDLFAGGQALRVCATAAMFFFGYVTTSIIVNWLPTILSQRSASPAMVSASFAAINGGGVVCILAIGLTASRSHSRALLPLAWTAAALCGLATLLGGLGTVSIAALAVLSATIGAGAQGLSVALANGLHPGVNMEGTSVGLMTGTGRMGQATALAASGVLLGAAGGDTLVFGMAGACSLAAAALALVVTGGHRP